MASKRKYFKVPYKELLVDMVLNLQLPMPIYNHLEVSKKTAFVVVRVGTGSRGYYFQGKSCKVLLESEEDAAEKVVMFLVKKYGLKVEDVNMDKKERLTTYVEFFRLMKQEM